MQEHTQTRGWPGIVLVWGIAAVGSAVVASLAYTSFAYTSLADSGTNTWFGDEGLGVFGALGIVLTASVFAALITQLASRRPEGFVSRVSWSIGGAVLIVALTAIAVAPVAAR